MQNEEKFNDAKLLHAAIEAVQQGAALPEEASVLEGAVDAHRVRRAKRKHERIMEHTRRTLCFQTPDKIDMHGKPVYIAPASLEAVPEVLAPIFAGLQRAGVEYLVDHPLAAPGGIFVLADPADADLCTQTVAILTGMDQHKFGLITTTRLCLPLPPEKS